MTDKEHAERINKLLGETSSALSEAKAAGLTVNVDFVHLGGTNVVSFSSTIRRITLIDSQP